MGDLRDEIEWPAELVDAIATHARELERVWLTALNQGPSRFPLLLAFMDGVDWCPIAVPASASTHGWSFALTCVEDMVENGAISAQAGDLLCTWHGTPDQAFYVFNVEMTRVNMKRFQLPYLNG